MAKNKESADVILHIPLKMSQTRLDALCGVIDGDALATDKIASCATRVLESLADGGLLLEPQQVKSIEESTGQQVASAEDLLPLVEAGAGRAHGKLTVIAEIDPCYEETMQNMADFQGCSKEEVAQRCFDEALDQGWLTGEITPSPARVLMSAEDKKALVEVLGGDFDNGTELAALVMKALNPTVTFD